MVFSALQHHGFDRSTLARWACNVRRAFSFFQSHARDRHRLANWFACHLLQERIKQELSGR
jgi:hypothetical protein